MKKDFEKLFSHIRPAEPPAGLFDRIILAIKREQELRQSRKLLFVFLSLLIISSAAVPFSWNLLINQIKSSGIFYFISTAAGNFNVSLNLWQDFSLAILESLPVTGFVIFGISLGMLIFTLRLFLYRKKLLFGYLIHQFN